ncbi:MAG: SDR family oxidoreductase [Acidobacteriia bacterium]|nr:SDR family oxidoreductase [Terriglobia bacterium]
MPKGTALVTGASTGIGADLARLCAAAGFDPILVARDARRLEELAARLAREYQVNPVVLPADLSDPSAPEAIFHAVPATPDILINNAGFGLRGAFADLDWGRQSAMIQVNVTSLAHLIRLFLPGMLRRSSGRILNVGSTAGFVPGPLMAVYYATKAFVSSFSEALSSEVGGTGVTVTLLCPGPTRTEFKERAGMQKTMLFKGPAMESADVAQEGFRAMMAGKRVHIAGARNRWMIRLSGLAPHGYLLAAIRRLNSETD